ncbi:D-cysteine desulfhydrase family protein [Variovorax saccharolyticus]|uniref:D-cysteine desulfhydrase family protein n=1 Tax=Variovorax saccharolyticus TaxID=3053516 RepID=UPI0025777880|nr:MULTISPECIES: D-cysteine desulfhydrase family protein [unclassified Variovorax]MDM0022307.1 D-cysteine desulfhydrase family protein [Variovorax sp. J22R187]MDM0028863.1 D-cysteine desulfhydrase family protein [Variovorax sp. J31P216]
MQLSQSLDRLPRRTLLDGPTSIQRLTRIEEALGSSLNGVRIYAKRDDSMALGGGGSKLRKLEFLLGDAAEAGADTIIATGGRQSNFARLAAASAARLGLACELVLSRMVPREGDDYDLNGNVLLDGLFGARLHDLPVGADSTRFAHVRAEELRRDGRIAYVATLGGSSPVGSIGYAACALEIQEQSTALGVDFAAVVVPNGSSGTQAGLVAGYRALGLDATRVSSHSVLAPAAGAIAATVEKANAVLRLLSFDASVNTDDVKVSGDQLGGGYGVSTPAMIEAVRLMASREGLLLDPVYGGKAFAGLLSDISAGRYAAGDNVLFLMTGGTPGLYAYASDFRGKA